MKYIVFTVLFLYSGFLPAQDKEPTMTPGRTIDGQQPKPYADSAEFALAFKEFYPFIKPEKGLKEQADQYFQGISRAFRMQGIDSAEAAKAAYKNLDEKAFEKIYFDTYRRNLSAGELKKYMEFIKTPEGKHISEVWSNLQRVTADANMYIARTMNLNLGPIRQAAHEKMEKENPNKKPGVPVSPTQRIQGDVFDAKNAGSKDSMIRAEQLKKKLPKSIDSLATPKRKK